MTTAWLRSGNSQRKRRLGSAPAPKTSAATNARFAIDGAPANPKRTRRSAYWRAVRRSPRRPLRAAAPSSAPMTRSACTTVWLMKVPGP